MKQIKLTGEQAIKYVEQLGLDERRDDMTTQTHTPTPWDMEMPRLRGNTQLVDWSPVDIVGSNGEVIGQFAATSGDLESATKNAEFMRLSWNSHDALTAENERLKKVNAELFQAVDAIKDAIDQEDREAALAVIDDALEMAKAKGETI